MMRTVETDAADQVGTIEGRGVEYIPEEERHSRPSELVPTFIGAQFSLTVIVVGWLPIAFGLGWWSSVSAITIGVLVGTLLYAPFALFGPRTGTNSAVSSGAHFGVVGRLIGSFLALFSALGFYAVCVWTGGEALVSGASKLFGTPESDALFVLAYALMAAMTVLIAVYGHATVVAAQKFVIAAIGGFMLIGFLAKLGDFDAGYAGGELLLGSSFATWMLAAVTAASIPISYGPFANDYSRYISARYSERSVAWNNGLGIFVGSWIVMVFGAYMATMFPADAATWVQGWVAISPTWYAVPILLIALLGTFAQGAVCLYGTGLDFSSLFPKLHRVPATLALSSIGVAFVYVGFFVWNLMDSVSAFVVILVVVTTPWMVINLLGYWTRRGWYEPADLQVFNEGRRGGIYWYTGGWNLRALGAWLPSVVVGLLFTQTTLLTGPWATKISGIDMSFISAALLAAVLYLLLTRLFPEPRETMGPAEGAPVAAGPLAAQDAAAPVVVSEPTR
jgi:purine-cytosine permease-like protein